ncbi:S9 family peptidase [Thalassotalea sp. HSM 43]|uniref:alpha/beta hydrolase family protein n=1 Tax=Thalassotalea sp. HSM 43 TaxID=2552945 RepID=UPI0010808FDC|nr:prolyl oligopeptidase family serine peptidase [Thalassotalea sp. HSM 43]QBY04030.1 S9 family peptidase [Thalassotalea sp. HSM 43]
MKAWILAFVTLAFSNNALAGMLIPVDDIFRDDSIFSMKLSPDGKHVFAYENNVLTKRNLMSVFDPVKETKTAIHNDLVIDYEWIDNDTVYVETNSHRGFIELDFSQQEPVGKWQVIGTSGYVISALPDVENTMIYVHTPGSIDEKHLIYKITVEQLMTRNFAQAELLDSGLDDALLYYYDNNNATIMAVSGDRKRKELKFWYKRTNKWRLFWKTDQNIEFIPVGFLNSKELAVLSNKDHDHVALVKFDIKTQTLGDVIYKHPMYDLASAQLNPMGQGVHSVTYLEHGIAKTEYFSTDDITLNERLNKNFDKQHVSIIGESLDKKTKLLATSGSDNPGQYFYLPAEQGQAKKIAARFPSMDLFNLNPSKTFKVEVEKDTFVEAIFTQPQDYDNKVLLVYPHGGPVGVRDIATFNRDVQFLTNRGYSVLQVNFRGSAGFGKKFTEAGKGQFGKLIEHDISLAVEQIRQQYQFDHMCSIGSSYGGYSAVMLAIKKPEQYQCIVSMYGIYDLMHLFNASNYKTTQQFRDMVSEVVGDFNDDLQAVSPFYFAEKVQAPILLIAGKKDEIADFEQANRMKYRLKQLNKDVETVFYNDVAHGHHNWHGDRHQFAYIDNFIRRKLNLPYATGANASMLESQERNILLKGYNLDDDSNAFRQRFDAQFDDDLDAQIKALEEQDRIDAEREAQAQKEIQELLNR